MKFDTYKRIANVWSSSQSNPKQAILQERGVCNEDVENVVDTVHAQPI
jgi:hypothetical protein